MSHLRQLGKRLGPAAGSGLSRARGGGNSEDGFLPTAAAMTFGGGLGIGMGLAAQQAKDNKGAAGKEALPAEYGGRERERLPLDPRAPPMVHTDTILKSHPHLESQLGHKFFAPVQPGEVNIKILHPPRSGLGGWIRREAALPAPYKPAVEVAARVAAASIAEEVHATGFGKHTQEWGWQVVVVPSAQRFVRSEGSLIMLSSSELEAHLRHAKHPSESIPFAIAREMARHVAQHGREQPRLGIQGGALREMESAAQDASLFLQQQQLEADRIAGLAMLRAGVSPARLPGALQPAGADLPPALLCSAQMWVLDAGYQLLRSAASMAGLPSQRLSEAHAEVCRTRRARAAGDVDGLERVDRRRRAQHLLQAAWEAAAAEGSAASQGSGASRQGSAQQGGGSKLPCPIIRVGRFELPAAELASLPESRAVHALMSLQQDSAPFGVRGGRLRQLALSPEALERCVGQPASVGHRPTNGVSGVDLVADSLTQAHRKQAAREAAQAAVAGLALELADAAVAGTL